MILLDTPLMAAWILGDPRLGPEGSALLGRGEAVSLSAIGLVELGEWILNGRLQLDIPFHVWIESVLSSAEILVLPVSPAVVARSLRLSDRLPDQYDRLHAATAIEFDLALATLDEELRGLPGVRYLF